MSLVRTYAYLMMFLHLSFLLLNATNMYPVEVSIVGVDIYDNMAANVAEISNTFQGEASALDYLAISGFVIVLGIKVVIQYFIMVFVGVPVILSIIGLPEVVYVPIGLAVDAVLLYDFGTTLLGRG